MGKKGTLGGYPIARGPSAGQSEKKTSTMQGIRSAGAFNRGGSGIREKRGPEGIIDRSRRKREGSARCKPAKRESGGEGAAREYDAAVKIFRRWVKNKSMRSWDVGFCCFERKVLKSVQHGGGGGWKTDNSG